MDTVTLQLSPELRHALQLNGGGPLQIQDAETEKVYLLVEQGIVSDIDDEEMRDLIQEALDDEARGDVAPFDMEEIKRKGREILARRQARRAE